MDRGDGIGRKICGHVVLEAVLADVMQKPLQVRNPDDSGPAKSVERIVGERALADTATEVKFPRAILPRTFDYGFATGLMYKDVKLCLEEAEELKVPMWVGSAVRSLWQYANGELGPASDFTAIVQCIEKWAGIEVKRGN